MMMRGAFSAQNPTHTPTEHFDGQPQRTIQGFHRTQPITGRGRGHRFIAPLPLRLLLRRLGLCPAPLDRQRLLRGDLLHRGSLLIEIDPKAGAEVLRGLLPVSEHPVRAGKAGLAGSER